MTYTYADWKGGKEPPEGWRAYHTIEDGWEEEEQDELLKAPDEPWSPRPQPIVAYSFMDWLDGKEPPEGWDSSHAVADGWSEAERDEFLSVTEALRSASEVLAVEPEWRPSPSPPSPHPVCVALRPSEGPVPIAGPAGPAPNPRPVETPASEPRTRPDGPSPERPAIYVVKGEIHEAVDRAVNVLSKPALEIYARGDDLVRAVTHGTPMHTLTVAKQGENIKRQDGSVIITTLSEAALVETLTRHSRFMKYDGRAEDFVPCDCPPEVARMVIALKGHGWTMPRLRGVIGAPTFRPDRSIITEPGYDAATGLLLVGDRLWRQVPDSPTQCDALDALDVLVEPIDRLPFVGNSDRAAALALLITSVMRPCLKTAPMFAVTAPAAGTGKSLTIDIAAIMATGRKAAVVTPTHDEAELEKRIGAAALAGDQIISIDNVTHILKSDQLCQMLTQEEVLVRVLGASKNVRIPSTSLICCTGNNLSVYGDLNRRTIRIRLDAKEERPEERPFEFDPCELALRKRAELVAAALTIVRAYLSAGAPRQTTPMGSFEDWSDTVRSALIWLSMGDCRGDVDEIRAEDPEKEELAEILRAMPAEPFTARDIAAKVPTEPILRQVLERFTGRGGVFSTKGFGRYLLRYSGTRIGGRWIERVGNDRQNSAIWRICSDQDF